MKYLLPVFATCVIGCGMGLQAQTAGSDSTKMDDSKMSDHSKMSSGKSAAMDMKFAKEAAAGGMAEVKLGQLAQDKGSSEFVKEFGKKMVEDHSKANDDLKSVASKNSIDLPTDVMPKDQILYDRLSKLSGDQFDSAYLAAMKKDHQKDIADFQKESTKGKNPDVKEFASKTLPVLQGHMQMLEAKKVM